MRFAGKKEKIMVMVLVVVLIMCCAACSIEDSLEGEYKGTAGSYLFLKSDGTCIYAEDDDTGSGSGTWYVEGEMMYIDVSNLSYVIFANVSDASEGFMLEANAGAWNDEYFKKVK